MWEWTSWGQQVLPLEICQKVLPAFWGTVLPASSASSRDLPASSASKFCQQDLPASSASKFCQQDLPELVGTASSASFGVELQVLPLEICFSPKTSTAKALPLAFSIDLTIYHDMIMIFFSLLAKLSPRRTGGKGGVPTTHPTDFGGVCEQGTRGDNHAVPTSSIPTTPGVGMELVGTAGLLRVGSTRARKTSLSGTRDLDETKAPNGWHQVSLNDECTRRV